MPSGLSVSDPLPAPAPIVRPDFVLVVDDEPFFAEVAMEFLLRAGYLATSPSTRARRAAQLEAIPRSTCCSPTSAMPGMDRFTLAAKAFEMRPGLRILYSSAHIE